MLDLRTKETRRRNSASSKALICSIEWRPVILDYHLHVGWRARPHCIGNTACTCIAPSSAKTKDLAFEEQGPLMARPEETGMHGLNVDMIASRFSQHSEGEENK